MVEGNQHTLLIVSTSSVSLVANIVPPRSGEATLHGFNNSITCAAVPFVCPVLTISHRIDLSISYHHDLSRHKGTFRPEPPALTLMALRVLRRSAVIGVVFRELLVTILRGLFIGYLDCFGMNFPPMKS